MPAARRGSRRRRQGFRQSVPLVIGGRVAQPRAAARPAAVLGVVGGLALLGLVLWFAFSPQFYVTEAQVVGAQRVPAEAIFAASGLQRLHILWASPRAAEARILETIPSIERVRVSCRLPARCVIAVTEREPVAAWDQGGTYYWVDRAGGAFPGPGPLEGRWQVSGPLPTDEKGLVARDVLVGLGELERLGIRPGRILYRPGRGLVLEDPAGWRVVLGQGTGMARRLQVYLKIRAHLLEKGITPKFVDVRFPDAPYYSATNEW
ncbi:MAG: FtsQ-type POTRA domain-containing protein [Thermoflexales bacterium]|nr:FtsQ-type POTRA domain-containing protein [Thermoflexales bacterium]